MAMEEQERRRCAVCSALVKGHIGCGACGILIGQGHIEQNLTQVTARKAVSTTPGLTVTNRIVTLRVCSSCLASIRRREKRHGVGWITPPGLYGGS